MPRHKNAKNSLTIFHCQHGHGLLPGTIELYIHNGALIRGVTFVVACDDFILFYIVGVFSPTHNPFCYADFQTDILIAF